MTLPLAFAEAGVPASFEKLAESLGHAATKTDGGLNGRELLKLDKNEGYWLYGIDGIELEENALVAINPTSFCHGYISWAAKGGSILGEVMVPVTDPVPTRNELPNTGESWDEQLSFDAQIINGEDAGVMIIYKSTALGGKEFIRDIMRRIVAKMHEGPNYIVPAIALDKTSYKHKTYGLIYKPAYSLAYWLNMHGDEEGKKLDKPPAESLAKSAEISEEKGGDADEMVAALPAEETTAPPPARRRGRPAKTETTAGSTPAPAARRRGQAVAEEPPQDGGNAPPARRRRRPAQ